LRPGEHLFHDGETSVSSIIETIGGGGANSAFAAASLGGHVTFLGKVGNDALGERLERALVKHGIAAHLAKDKSAPSGTSIALNFESGHRHFVSCQPANESLTFADLNVRVLAGHDHLLRADIWFSESMLFGGNEQLFRAASKLGLAVSIDLNWDPKWGRAPAAEIHARKEAVRSLLRWVDLVHGNARELLEFSEAVDLDTALQRITGWGAKAVIVHLGAKGASYYCGGSFIVEPPVPVERELNMTGTGDILSICMILLHRRTDLAPSARLHLANSIVSQFIEGKRRLIPALTD
jgi:sugar/nucleoside kinase (ribokinase family)